MISKTRRLTRIALFAALMSISAYIRVPIGPVPLTLQTFAALSAGYCLGPSSGAAAMILYALLGLAGLPVFSSGSGPAYVLSPTFGYIIGFVFAALLTGQLAKYNRRESPIIAYLIMLAGLAAIYIPGVLWLGVALVWIADIPSNAETVLKIGLLTPLAGDLLTTVPAAALSVRLRKILS